MRTTTATGSNLRVTKEIEPYIAAAKKAEAWQVRQLSEKLRKANEGMSGISRMDCLLLASHCDQIALEKEMGK